MCQINLNQTHILAIQQTEINSNLTETVNAEELHQFLEVKTPYDQWIKRRVDALGLEENQDFTTFQQKSWKVIGRPKTELWLTIEAAKHLSMAERNQKGKEARSYFIAIEKKAKAALPQLQQQNKKLLDLFLNSNPLYGKIVRYSQLGLNATETAKLCDLSVDALRHHRVKLADLYLIDPPALGAHNAKSFTLADLDSMATMYSNGLKPPAIAKHFNCSPQTIRSRLKTHFPAMPSSTQGALNRNRATHA